MHGWVYVRRGGCANYISRYVHACRCTHPGVNGLSLIIIRRLDQSTQTRKTTDAFVGVANEVRRQPAANGHDPSVHIVYPREHSSQAKKLNRGILSAQGITYILTNTSKSRMGIQSKELLQRKDRTGQARHSPPSSITTNHHDDPSLARASPALSITRSGCGVDVRLRVSGVGRCDS